MFNAVFDSSSSILHQNFSSKWVPCLEEEGYYNDCVRHGPGNFFLQWLQTLILQSNCSFSLHNSGNANLRHDINIMIIIITKPATSVRIIFSCCLPILWTWFDLLLLTLRYNLILDYFLNWIFFIHWQGIALWRRKWKGQKTVNKKQNNIKTPKTRGSTI